MGERRPPDDQERRLARDRPRARCEPRRREAHAYKIVADGNWRLDPKNRYRKIVDGQMNSGLVLLVCDAGSETLSGKLEVSGGDMKVRVSVRSDADGDTPERVKASLDNGGVPNGSFAIDAAAGAIDFSFAASQAQPMVVGRDTCTDLQIRRSRIFHDFTV